MQKTAYTSMTLTGTTMNIGITGHTKGLGHAFFKLFKSQGHEVVGFSRSNGHDIVEKIDDITACYIHHIPNDFNQSFIAFINFDIKMIE